MNSEISLVIPCIKIKDIKYINRILPKSRKFKSNFIVIEEIDENIQIYTIKLPT